jgi:hypothetical protein
MGADGEAPTRSVSRARLARCQLCALAKSVIWGEIATVIFLTAVNLLTVAQDGSACETPGRFPAMNLSI